MRPIQVPSAGQLTSHVLICARIQLQVPAACRGVYDLAESYRWSLSLSNMRVATNSSIKRS